MEKKITQIEIGTGRVLIDCGVEDGTGDPVLCFSVLDEPGPIGGINRDDVNGNVYDHPGEVVTIKISSLGSAAVLLEKLSQAIMRLHGFETLVPKWLASPTLEGER